MTSKTVAQKARLKPGTAIAVLNPVPGVVESLGLPPDTAFVDPAQAQLVFLFVTTRAELEARMPPAVAALAPGATIWVFYRKGSRAAGLDMSRDDVWAVAEQPGPAPAGAAEYRRDLVGLPPAARTLTAMRPDCVRAEAQSGQLRASSRGRPPPWPPPGRRARPRRGARRPAG